MKLVPIFGPNDDPADLQTQWIAYARSYWYDQVAGPALVTGTAGGLVVPDFGRDFARVLPFPSATPFRPPRPWEAGLKPPPLTTETVAVTRPARGSLITPAAEAALPWLKPVPPGRAPLFDLKPPPSVVQIDPWQPPAQSPIGAALSDYERHQTDAAIATLTAAFAVQPLQRTLPMRATRVVGALRRGAKIVWENKKAILKRIDDKVLGPVGVVGSVWDLYQFIKWVNSKGVFDDVQGIPKAVYQPTNNSIEFTMADGTVIVEPAWQLPEYVKYRY
ncbi:hypothetical protein [Micropruina sonneratiae]|uniref:hypothetical protein n=1 Tax=Micropruina sonneratiae TaxID=2986940 RepID=UPI002227D186|nr:hypothetical protein [Micropruina sp. KQZ13P-5]MCW3159452.1 hypothetical protein [Micropruina sp. KQZ13P-5]